jgi:hypothetical protein
MDWDDAYGCVGTETDESSAMFCLTDDLAVTIDCPSSRGFGANGNVVEAINVGAEYSGKERCNIEVLPEEEVVENGMSNKSGFLSKFR